MNYQIMLKSMNKLGLMIWHDFQFACSIYPETDQFEKKVLSILKTLSANQRVDVI